MNLVNPLIISLLRCFRFIEKTAAFIQGKGYGSGTIKKEICLVRKFLVDKNVRVAIDIGGNIGDYSAELRRMYPELEIHVFEPSSANLVKLEERFSGDKYISIVPYAASDNTGVATLFSNLPGSGLGSLALRRLTHFNIDFNVTEKVSTLRFEEYWFKTLGCRKLDIVKIDVEGHELAVLTGFGKAIDAVDVVQFEFGGCNIDTGTYFQDFWYFFREHNFLIFRISPLGLDPITSYREVDEFFLTTNYIAVRKY